MTATLRSIQVALPHTFDDPAWQDAPWESAFAKQAVRGAVEVGETNLAGDRQGDRLHHGGPDKAVLAYAAAHYPEWERELAVTFPYGGFGENLTIAGLDEDTVCLGDRYGIAACVLEVCQPRIPCWKISHRWGRKDLTKRVEQTGRTGWYLRVIATGTIEAGQPVRLLARPHPEWTITRATRVMRRRTRDREAAAELASLPPLAAAWRTILGLA